MVPLDVNPNALLRSRHSRPRSNEHICLESHAGSHGIFDWRVLNRHVIDESVYALLGLLMNWLVFARTNSLFVGLRHNVV